MMSAAPEDFTSTDTREPKSIAEKARRIRDRVYQNADAETRRKITESRDETRRG